MCLTISILAPSRPITIARAAGLAFVLTRSPLDCSWSAVADADRNVAMQDRQAFWSFDRQTWAPTCIARLASGRARDSGRLVARRRLPAPRVRTPLVLKNPPTLDRENRHHRLTDPQAGAQRVVDHPIALAHLEHRDIRLPANSQAAQALLFTQRRGRVGGIHGDHLLESEAQAQETGHHLDQAVDGVGAARNGQVGTDAVRHEALVEHLARDVEAEVEPTVGG